MLKKNGGAGGTLGLSDKDKSDGRLDQSEDLADKAKETARDQAIEELMNDKKFVEMIEDIAMELLRPNLPVISIKKLKNAVKEALRERQHSFLDEKSFGEEGVSKRIKSEDLEDLQELVHSLILPLQRAVYTENKVSLYNKDGAGLNFALQDGVQEHLEKGDDAFYYNIFSHRTLKDVENPDYKSSSPSVNDIMSEHNSQPAENANSD